LRLGRGYEVSMAWLSVVVVLLLVAVVAIALMGIFGKGTTVTRGDGKR
jgi:hypothetical protein